MRSNHRFSLRFVAGGLAIWLSGVVLVLCCHMQQAEAADFCPLAKFGAHCDKAEKGTNSEKLTNQNDECGLDCCSFIPSFYDKTRVLDHNGNVAVVSSDVIEIDASQKANKSAFVPFYTYRPVVLLRNDSF